ncbi:MULTISPECIES: hypothetical protein [Paenibacillus]|uniref:hypothetical protein n=1 Tax=Paenibacillus TaxID=44249 RepID=UPI0022B8FDA1|nr:hypothetical protein [Paenibacillus caseinilyticus]
MMTGAALEVSEPAGMRWTIKAKTEVLKIYEGYAYQVAYYLLQSEEGALAAAKEALLELYGSEPFYEAAPQEREKRVKATAVRHALKVRSRGAHEEA